MTEKNKTLLTENNTLESELTALRKQTGSQKLRHQKTEQIDSRVKHMFWDLSCGCPVLQTGDQKFRRIQEFLVFYV